MSAGGDLFWIDAATGKWTQLTDTPAAERDPKLSPDATRVAFRRGHDLYVLDIAAKTETRLTRNGTATLLNGELDWVYPEELDLGTAYRRSPDGKSIADNDNFDTSRVPLYPQADLLKTKALAEPERYPQAGDPNSDVRIGVIPASGGARRVGWIWVIRATCGCWPTYWTPDSKALYVVRCPREQNRLDLLKANVQTGATVDILRETDSLLDQSQRPVPLGRRRPPVHLGQ